MTSFWEILKSSKNLKASDAFAELWGKSIADSWDIITITGTLPLTFLAEGSALTDYRLYGTSEGGGEQTGGTEPAGYKIPLTVTSGEQSDTYPVYIGDTKLGAEEYVDYGEQKVYKRTENLHNEQTDLKDYRILWSTGALVYSQGSAISDYIAVSEGRIYSANRNLLWVGYNSQKTYLGTWYSDANDFAKDGFSSAVNTLTIPNGCLYIRLLVVGQYINDVVLVQSDTPPETYIPYLQPTDPPAPLPAIQAYQGENTLSSAETVGEVSVTGKIREI